MADARIKELEAQLEKWKRRALAFQEGYREKSFEVTGLEIQLMDLRAHGADKVTARQNDSLRTKLLAACVERNEAREENIRLAEALQYIFDHDDACECDCDNDNCCRLQGSKGQGPSVFCPRCIARGALNPKG